jgi:hypothetical protein
MAAPDRETAKDFSGKFLTVFAKRPSTGSVPVLNQLLLVFVKKSSTLEGMTPQHDVRQDVYGCQSK